MAEKVIAVKIDVQGTADQKKKIVGLELNLKKLTDQQKKLKKQVKDGEITNEQYAKSISKVNLGLKGTRRQLLVTRQAMLGIDGFTTRLGKSFRKFGTSVSGAFVGLFAAQKLFQVMSDGLNTVKEFEQGAANLASVLGTTSDGITALTNDAKRLGAATSFSAVQVTQLQTEFAKLGFNEKEILNATEATLDLAAATGSELADAAAVAGATLGGFGLDAKETSRVTDVMAKSFSTSALDLEKFKESMKSAAPAAKAVGISVETTTALLGTLANAGISGSKAGSNLKTALINLNNAGLTLDEGLKQVANSQDKLGASSKLVGKNAAATFLVLAEGIKTTKNLEIGLKNAEGAAKAMANTQLDTLEGDLKKLSSAFEGLILGNGGTDFFRDLTQGATELLSAITDLTSNTHEESEALEEQRIAVNVLVGRITDLNEGTDERKKLIEELNRISPKFLQGLDRENLTSKILVGRLSEINDQYINQIILKRESEKISEQAEIIATSTQKKLELESKIRTQFVKDKTSILNKEKRLEKLAKSTSLGARKRAEKNLVLLKEKLEIINDLSITEIQKAEKLNIIQNKARTSRSLFDKDDLSSQLFRLQKANEELEVQKNIGKAIKAKADEIKKELFIEAEKEESKKESIILDNKLLDSKKELNKEEVKTKKLTKAEKEAEKEAKRLEAENKRRLKAEERFLAKVDKLKKSSSLLAIEDERKLQLEKLRLQKEALEAEAKLKISEKGKLDSTLLSLTSSFKNKEDEINKNFDKKQLLIDNSELEKESLKKQKKIDDIISVGEFALNSSSVLIDSLSNIELQKEKEKLDNKLITEKEFAVLKYNIEKKAFERQKKVDITQAIMNGAVGITKAFAQGGILGAITGAIVAASTSVQIASISKQKYPSASFADGGFTGGGSGIADETGFKQAGIVHEGEYVVPKHVLGTSEGSSLVGALENMRTNQPMPNLGIGYANGGMVSSGNIDLQGLENRMSKAITNSLSSIQVTNVATETTSQAIKVNNIEQEASFG